MMLKIIDGTKESKNKKVWDFFSFDESTTIELKLPIIEINWINPDIPRKKWILPYSSGCITDANYNQKIIAKPEPVKSENPIFPNPIWLLTPFFILSNIFVLW